MLPAVNEIADNIDNQHWRLNNLYWGIDKRGKIFRFRMNAAQELLWRNLWYLNIVLKARQLGFSTFIDLLLLDSCLFIPDQRANIIAHTKDDAKILFRDKVKFPFENLPPELKTQLEGPTDSVNELQFSNGSAIRVTTSGRGSTAQFLHISEYGKLCAASPEKATEVRTGALNTVHKGQMVFIESTAEGRSGHFYDLCQESQNMLKEGRILTPLDYRFHFFSWLAEPEYTLSEEEAGETVFTKKDQEYFKELDEKGIETTVGQRAWYVKKALIQQDEMMREYPTTPEEAFHVSLEGAYYTQEMSRVRSEKRICKVPFEPDLPVNTFWDLGMDDSTFIVFHQYARQQHRFIDCEEHTGEGLKFYARILSRKPYVYGRHYFPHDAAVRELGTGERRTKTAYDLGIRPNSTVPRIKDHMDGIDAVRNVLGSCWFDESKCARLVDCLDHYRKEWDEKLGKWKSTPLHDEFSHGAKAFEQFAVGYRPGLAGSGKAPKKKKQRPSWKII